MVTTDPPLFPLPPVSILANQLWSNKVSNLSLPNLGDTFNLLTPAILRPWVFLLPVCWILYGWYRENLLVNHFWELRVKQLGAALVGILSTKRMTNFVSLTMLVTNSSSQRPLKHIDMSLVPIISTHYSASR